MITAERIAATLTPTYLTTLHVGEERTVGGLALHEPGSSDVVDPTDLVLVVGARDEHDLLEVVDAGRGSAGLIARHGIAVRPAVVKACRDHGLTLLALADDAVLSSTVTILRDVIDQAARTASSGWSPQSVYTDLFSLADVLSTLINAPVTIEDARSRVLAYSTGQFEVDEARTSTIIGRQVPAALRDQLRALGVFRRLARSDEPFFVPARDTWLKGRLIIPVRAGGEWLGSVWAVMDEEPPADKVASARTAAAVLALHLLRLRAMGDLARQLQREQVGALLRGELVEPPDALPDGPWRAVALTGPRAAGEPEERVTVWTALGQRHGWRQPVLGDLDGVVHAVVSDAPVVRPGTWAWLRGIVESEASADATLGAAAGRAVETPAGLGESAGQARELLALTGTSDSRTVLDIDTDWAPVVIARAARGLRGTSALSPLQRLVAQDEEQAGDMVATLCAVIDHWGEPQRAARALGVHPNTVRNRLARLTKDPAFDLEDPTVRLALRLEALALRES